MEAVRKAGVMAVKPVDIMCLKTEKAYRRGVVYGKAGDMALNALYGNALISDSSFASNAFLQQIVIVAGGLIDGPLGSPVPGTRILG